MLEGIALCGNRKFGSGRISATVGSLDAASRMSAMHPRRTRSLPTLWLLMTACLATPAAALAQTFPPLQGDRYLLQVRSQLEPVAINRIHAWTLELRDRDGALVTDATITVRGGMPAHQHGLPTAPRVTEVLGPGRYLLEGMKFQMGGEWEVQFLIEAPPGAETLTLAFTL